MNIKLVKKVRAWETQGMIKDVNVNDETKNVDTEVSRNEK